MSFVDDVRQRRVPWPTQQKYTDDAWIKAAVAASTGPDDVLLGMSGLWVSGILRELRGGLSSSLWSCGFARTGRLLIGEANRTVVVMREHVRRVIQGHEGPLFQTDFAIRYSPAEGVPGVDLDAQAEAAVDNLDRVLAYVKQECGSDLGTGAFDINELLRLWSGLGSYAQIEQLFYEFMWGKTRLSYNDDFGAWHLLPTDVDEELVWAASLERFQAHVQEVMLRTRFLWKNSPALRRSWHRRTGGVPIFSIQRTSHKDIGILAVRYKRRKVDPPEEPPMSEVFNSFALDLISEDEIRSERGSGFSIHDLLATYGCLEAVGKQLASNQQDLHVSDEAGMIRFAPALERASLLTALSEATGVSLIATDKILHKLSWKPQSGPGSLWHTPLVPFEIDGSAVLCPVLLALVHPNPHRLVEYWLSELGVALDERGPAFERYAVAQLNRSVDSRFASLVSVWHPDRVDSRDGTYEEIDLLMRLNDRFVLAELKCNKFPDNPTGHYNYLADLRKGAMQASRKSSWLRGHADEFSARFQGIDVAVNFVPIVISNQSIGVGVQFGGVPVVDLTLLMWYLGRPYLSIGRASPRSGDLAEMRSPPLYEDAAGLGREFDAFAHGPPPLLQYLARLRLEDVPFMLRTLLGKPVIRCIPIVAHGPTVHPEDATRSKV